MSPIQKDGGYLAPEKNCTKDIRYDSPHSVCDFGLDFDRKEYVEIHGLGVNRRELNFDIDKINNGSIVFIKWDYTGEFIKKLPELNYKLSKTNSKIVLLTGRGDSYITQDATDYILSCPTIGKWFRCNPVSWDPRIEFFPIGFGEVERPYGCPELLDSFYNEEPKEKIDKVYVPVFSSTNHQRANLITQFIEKHKDMCVVEDCTERLEPREYLNKLSTFKYCLSLCGGGYDVHRNYECLLTSTIPVMQHSPVRDYYGQLGISCEPLENFTGTTNFNSEDKEKVLYNYWYDKLKKAQKEIFDNFDA
mgnify:CR=1 FL=1